ncbi:MAG: ATP-binding protein, partial [Proteobacteria bacterium]|nr:ATP-binding protein [Pseudomonadota bacterium]
IFAKIHIYNNEMYTRAIDIRQASATKSLLLIGPRQTGKSTLLRTTFPEADYYNLVESDTFRELSARPELVRERLGDSTSILIIDEAQRVPDLFNECQVLLDRNPKLRIVLTGSSARALKRRGVNLLPGRIFRRELFPLVSAELGKTRIDERLVKGSLPGIIDSPLYREELRNYVSLYLDEEVRAEGLVRGIGAFARFLPIAALTHGNQVNFAKISRLSEVKVNTVRSYFDVLIDTLLGFELPAWRKSRTRKASATSKFYFFDMGVVNGILNQFESHAQTSGIPLEHLVLNEVRAYLSYNQLDLPIAFWRTSSGIEVDLLIGEKVAVEIKATRRAIIDDMRGLVALAEDLPHLRRILVCNEPTQRKLDNGIEIIPVEDFLVQLWNKQIV